MAKNLLFFSVKTLAVFAVFSLCGCISMPESERELIAGKEEAQRLQGKDISSIKLETPDNISKSDVSVLSIYKKMNFNPSGRGVYQQALRDPIGAHYARTLKNHTVALVEELFPGIDPVDNEADAFRHAYFSFMLADKIGAKRAKAFTDAYEISFLNTMGARCMDLWNNNEGRKMCEESKSDTSLPRNELAQQLVLNAIKNNRLVLKPFVLVEDNAEQKAAK